MKYTMGGCVLCEFTKWCHGSRVSRDGSLGLPINMATTMYTWFSLGSDCVQVLVVFEFYEGGRVQY